MITGVILTQLLLERKKIKGRVVFIKKKVCFPLNDMNSAFYCIEVHSKLLTESKNKIIFDQKI